MGHERTGPATHMPSTPGGERKYQAIARDLRAAIHRGEYAPGMRLPGENDLMRGYDVARMTARQALAVLINEGLAVPRKGAGVYVRDFLPIIREGIAQLSTFTWVSGRSIWSADTGSSDLRVDQVEVHRDDPPDRIRVLLDLEPDAQVVVRSRRFVLAGKPVLLSTSYLPAAIVAGSRIEQDDTGLGGIYECLAELGHGPERFREDLRSRMPEPDEAERLGIPAGTPVVDIIRSSYSATKVVEVNEMTADASAYIFRYDFGA